MIVKLNIYSVRFGGVIVTSSDMSQANDWGLIGQTEIDISEFPDYDWAAHDERKRKAALEHYRNMVKELEEGV